MVIYARIQKRIGEKKLSNKGKNMLTRIENSVILLLQDKDDSIARTMTRKLEEEGRVYPSGGDK